MNLFGSQVSPNRLPANTLGYTARTNFERRLPVHSVLSTASPSSSNDLATCGHFLSMEGESFAGKPAEALEQLYERYAGPVMGFCLRRTDYEDAKDVVAETFLVAWRRLDVVPDDPLPWLLSVARNVLSASNRSMRRRHALANRIHDNAPAGTGDFTGEVHNRVTVGQAMEQLSPIDQDILMLTCWDRLSARSAARVLGCSEPAARVRLHRARRRMAAQLRGQLSIYDQPYKREAT